MVLNDLKDKLKYNRDLTNIGQQHKLNLQLMTEDQLYRFSPERYQFYMQFLDALQDTNPKLVENVLTIENNSRFTREKMEENMRKIAKDLKYLAIRREDGKANPADIQCLKDLVNAHNDDKMFINPIKGGGPPGPERSGPEEAAPKQSFFTEKLHELQEAKKAKNYHAIQQIMEEIREHPLYSPEFNKISTTDRIVFIAVTFVLRGISLFLIDWGINSRMITDFNKAFFVYLTCYIAFFLVWVTVSNIGGAGENSFFKIFFYYVNLHHGPGRILVHLLVQLLLVPVPLIVKERVLGETPDTSYDHGRKVFRFLSNFTLFMWILTSMIALRY